MTLPPATAFRPLPIRLANRTLPSLWARRLLPPADLEEGTIEAMAVRQTDLSDFGDDRFWRGQLRLLLTATREEARLNGFGTMIAHGSALKVMKERLWAERLFAEHPEIDRIDLAPPIIVVGPMRSGTTRLQRLLAQDPRFTALRLYEAMCPVPWPKSFTARVDPRITYTRRGLAALNWINPGNAAVHPTGPLEVDEELGLLEQSFTGAMIEAQRRVPAFARHGETSDQRPAYAHMRRLLKLRSWFTGTDPARPYILKTPQHMQDLPALAATFPSARYVFTHRDPLSVVGSACSLVWNQMVVQSDDVDPRWIGAEWLHKTEHRIAATEAARTAIDPAHQVDVTYAEMDADWEATIGRLYRWLGLELKPAVLSAMRAYVERAEREHRHRAHRYRLEDFGLRPGAVAERFVDYAGRYDVA